MQAELCLEQHSGQFEEAEQEVLTYVLSEQLECSRTRSPKKHHRLTERHKLEFLPLDKAAELQFDLRQINKSIRKTETNLGKVIKIGHATFRSNFECGNLENVSISNYNCYQIELKKETNSNRRSAWFYFSVEGLKGEVYFTVKGFTKATSLYNEGMKICYRDTKDLGKWRRGGTRISYTQSDQQQQFDKHKYELRFSHFFKNNEVSCIEFAYCFPYGLKKLGNLLNQLNESEVSMLGTSYNGHKIPLITVGNHKSQKVIVLSARVHPGQTVSSFIIEGFLKELHSDNQYGKFLRQHFLFKVIPILNPDGVIHGNYRFSSYGCDLNRRWKCPKESYQPQIYCIKELIKSLNKERKVMMYIDMHGHSRKKNVFFYGCSPKQSSNPKPKAFPLLMQKMHEAFKFENCCFAIQKGKEGTARIAVWKQLKIDYVYTLEASFCGSEYGSNYLELDYERIGKKLCEGVAALFFEEVTQENNNLSHNAFRNLQRLATLKQRAIQELISNPQLMRVGQNEDDSGSESEPESGEISERDRNPQTGLPKPEVLNREKEQSKARRIKISTKFLSQQSIYDSAKGKIKSEVLVEEPKKPVGIEIKEKNCSNIIIIEGDRSRSEKTDFKVANSVNTFELETLRASSLHQRNLRVHSITRNNQLIDKKKGVNPCTAISTPQTDKEGRIKINLIQGREGAQYRRVRKLAEENMKKVFCEEESNKIVKELHGNQIEIQSSNNIGPQPRFYPISISQQRNRRQSLETYIKRQAKPEQFKRLSINGDELNVRCIGKHVFI